VASATGEGFEGRSYTVSGEDWDQFLSTVGRRDRGRRAHRLDRELAGSAYPCAEPLHAATQPGTPRDPPVHTRIEELRAARLSEERVRVSLEEHPVERPRLRIGEVPPELRSRQDLPWIPPCSAWSTAAVSGRSRICEVALPECTVWYMFQMVQRKAATERTAHGASALISDATRYPGWRLWSVARTNRRERPRLAGRRLSSGCGSSPRYFGGHPVSVEKIPEAEAGRRLTCTVIGGIPVRHYRPGVTLAAVDGGTAIGGPLPGTSRLRPPVRVSCARNAQSAEALADAAERQGEYVAAGQS
jgi:hypothetical protein